MTEIVLAYDKSAWLPADIDLFAEIRPHIAMLKVGLEAESAPVGIRSTVAETAAYNYDQSGSTILRDKKLHDIPNTIAGAVRNLTGRVGGVTIHASAGPKGLGAAARARYEQANSRNQLPMDTQCHTILFGVTVLTSHDETECVHIFGDTPGNKVLQFARDCASVGIDGLVCSGKELRLLQEHGLADKFMTLVPGGRPEWASTDDQKRVLTPREIATLGATYAVFGRPILKGPYTPLEAIKLLNEELSAR